MVVWTYQTWCLCIRCFPPCLWCLFLTPSVPTYPESIGWGQCITACLKTPCASVRHRARTWRSWRISPEKGVEQAIAIAQRVGMPLKIAAKVDRADREYFQEVVQPLLKHSLVEYVGEVGGDNK